MSELKLQKVFVPVADEQQKRLSFWNDAAGKWDCSEDYLKEQEGYFMSVDELENLLHAAKYSGLSVIDYIKQLNL